MDRKLLEPIFDVWVELKRANDPLAAKLWAALDEICRTQEVEPYEYVDEPFYAD
jgi:hypothetical protein